jgi:sugar phosphate isomerase/epimerase
MTTISFMSANFVARELGYAMTGGWGQGDQATQAQFRPPESFAAHFDALLAEIAALGFQSIDLWTGHLNPSWATPEQIEAARALLAAHGLRVASLAGWFGASEAEFEQSCHFAVALDCPILGGSTGLLAHDRPATLELLRRHGLLLGLENHPEKTPAELLAKIGDNGDGLIGACVDTGWFATQGYDAAQAIEELRDALVYVHLKDVRAVGAHDTCGFGEGIVPLRACVAALRRIGYSGGISVEHEPEDRDPRTEIAASYDLLQEWLSQ